VPWQKTEDIARGFNMLDEHSDSPLLSPSVGTTLAKLSKLSVRWRPFLPLTSVM